jgi:uncharacterized cupredoxin-like copper-binding protein
MALLLTGVLAACGTDSDDVEPTVTRVAVEGAPPTRTATSPSDATPEAPAGEVSPAPAGAGEGGELPTTIEIDMVDVAFEPTELTIPANTDVTINAVNKGALPHTFTLADVADTGEVAGGSSAQVVVNLPAGEYDFHCAVPGHADAGMVGKLTVVEGGGAAAAASPESGETAASPEVAGTPAETEGEGTAPAAPTEVEVDMVDLAFNPTELTIPADTDVTVNLVNSGALPHTFDVEDVESGEIPGGGTGSVTVNLPVGTYEYWCAIPGHKEAGMVGKLTVVAGSDTTSSAATPETAGAPGETELEASPGASPAASPGASPVASPVAATSVDVDMVEMAFEPSEFTIAANTDVTINLTNSGFLPHTFTVEGEEGADSGTIDSGQSGTLVLNLAPGTYDFICAIPGHKESGMVGKLTVVEPEDSAESTDGSSAVSAEPVALDMVELAFKPDAFEIPANTDVTINLTNSGNLPHNFSIPTEDVSVDLAAGESTTFVLNLPAGAYDFDCAVPGHKDAGMVGKLTVK